jgi:ubiquinone/menaquinone biosynthesis C-methylase UbiE
MLSTAREKLRRSSPRAGWLAAAADHRYLPLRAGATDLIVSGWSVSYVVTWYPETWRYEAEAWYQEAGRVLRASGTVILFESLGTGNESPMRLPHLENFYGWLEENGFQYRWIRTDYRFDSLEQAQNLAGFFFGDEMKSSIQRGTNITLPECTGVWWKQV